MKREKFIKELSLFAEKLVNSAKKENELFSQGGWAGWANIKLAKYLISKGETIVEIEKNIYGKKSANLVVDGLVVEMKCQSSFSPTNIVEKVKKDCSKLGDLEGNYEKVVLFFLVTDHAECFAAIKEKVGSAYLVYDDGDYAVGYCKV